MVINVINLTQTSLANAYDNSINTIDILFLSIIHEMGLMSFENFSDYQCLSYTYFLTENKFFSHSIQARHSFLSLHSSQIHSRIQCGISMHAIAYIAPIIMSLLLLYFSIIIILFPQPHTPEYLIPST